MARFLIQLRESGKFLCPDPKGGEPIWVQHLNQAGGGVFADEETAIQLIHDNCDFEDGPMLIDLDRLGTVNDYPIAEG